MLGPCSQQCRNILCSYTCSCYEGYFLANDQHTCIGNLALLSLIKSIFRTHFYFFFWESHSSNNLYALNLKFVFINECALLKLHVVKSKMFFIQIVNVRNESVYNV